EVANVGIFFGIPKHVTQLGPRVVQVAAPLFNCRRAIWMALGLGPRTRARRDGSLSKLFVLLRCGTANLEAGCGCRKRSSQSIEFISQLTNCVGVVRHGAVQCRSASSHLDLSDRRSSRVPAPRTDFDGGACTDARRIGFVTAPSRSALPRCRRAATAAAGRRRPFHADPFPLYRSRPFRPRLRRVGGLVLLSLVTKRPFVGRAL